MDEPEQVVERYSKRSQATYGDRYSMLNPTVWSSFQERQRHLIQSLLTQNAVPITQIKVLAVGCGNGFNLLELLQLGLMPENLIGNELLPERVEIARKQLPETTKVLSGDATKIDIPPESLDMVYQSVVFSSLLDD